jgi:hypothetical protein
MRYFVIGDDGQKYGPADVPTLNQWITDGRLLATTIVENEATGERMSAQAVPGLNFPIAAPPQSSGPVGNYGAPSPMGTPAPTGYVPPASAYPRPGSSQVVPKGFNWGAFYFNWIWGLNHRKYLMLISLVIGFIPYVGILGLPLAIWFGFQGNQWAWESGRFTTIADMMACQRIWAKWALGVFLFSLVVGVIAVIILGSVIASQPSLRN